MRVVLPAALLAEIRRHGQLTYPEECCGFLVAKESAPDDESPRKIVRVAPMQNRMEGARRRRFSILPEELRTFESSLEGTGELLVGFYHSHPDHPAFPSRFDQDHAWPWYSYLVLAVDHGRPEALGAFELTAEDRRFIPVELIVEPGPVAER